MNPFTVRANKRQVEGGKLGSAAPITLAWGAVQSWSKTSKDLKCRLDEAERDTDRLAIVLGDAHFSLARLIGSSEDKQFSHYLRRLEKDLKTSGVMVASPEGAAYSDELSDVLENVGQHEDALCADPMVHEVLQPIIMRNGEVIRFGKAIIAVPKIDQKAEVEAVNSSEGD